MSIAYQSTMAIYEDVVAALLNGGDQPVVVFVGPPSRTWFVDQALIRDLMILLHGAAPDVCIVHGGKYPFDYWVEHIATELKIRFYMDGPHDRSERLSDGYTRDPYLAHGAALLVAFPREDADEKVEYPVESADLDVVRTAQAEGVPILTVRRSGTWVLGGH